MVDILLVSLGSTGGLRAADDELCASLQRAGASVAIARPLSITDVRTLMFTDFVQARAVRRVAREQLNKLSARAVIYSTTTAALLWPRPGAIRFDAPAAGNRPGRHGLWQRPLERRRLSQASLLLPWSAGGLAELGAGVGAHVRAGAGVAAGAGARPAVVTLPVPVEPSRSLAGSGSQPGSGPQPGVGARAEKRDIAAITYAANPEKKGLARVLDAWRVGRKPGEELIITGVTEAQLRHGGYLPLTEGVRVAGPLARPEYRALLRRSKVFVCAARREDYGIAQLEALADGCQLVTTVTPGPYAALPLARALDARLVGDDLGRALRIALDNPTSEYPARALEALAPFTRPQTDRVVSEQVLPQLLATSSS